MSVKINLVKTCDACPEQYDAYINGLQVGYIRCRWGEITVKCPDAQGETVYHSITDGYGKLLDTERDTQLEMCIKAIERWNERKKEQYNAMVKVINELENASDAIYHALYGTCIEDEALERLAELLDSYVTEYEKLL